MNHTVEDVVLILNKIKRANKKVVLVTGVFDVLHQEHEIFLKKAKAAGEYLIVGLESDQRVKRIKGPQRPVNTELQRVRNIEKLKTADFTFILPKVFDKPNDHEDLIKKIQPDILAVSSHTKYIAEKIKIIEKYKGKVKIVHEYNPLFSSTMLIQDKKL